MTLNVEPHFAGLEGQVAGIIRAARALRHGTDNVREVQRLARDLVSAVDAFEQAWKVRADRGGDP